MIYGIKFLIKPKNNFSKAGKLFRSLVEEKFSKTITV
jgi:hypothetical protein